MCTSASQLPPGLVRYGDLVGEAFQLRDDLLGVFGDRQRTGKPVGEDLACGKPTQLLAYAADNGRMWFVLRPPSGARTVIPGYVSMQTLLLGLKPVR